MKSKWKYLLIDTAFLLLASLRKATKHVSLGSHTGNQFRCDLFIAVVEKM